MGGSSERPDVNRINAATVGGALATIGFTVVLLSGPDVVPFERLRDWLFETTGVYWWDNPFPSLRLLGGFGGGFVAGYLTRGRWDQAVVNTSVAVVSGLAVFTAVRIVYNLVTFPGLTSSIAIVLVFQSIFFVLLPYALLYLFQGTIAGIGGNWLAGFLADRVSPEAPQGTRAALAIIAFLAGFALLWWFGFYFDAVY